MIKYTTTEKAWAYSIDDEQYFWGNSSDPEKDVKLNIERQNISSNCEVVICPENENLKYLCTL